MPPIVTSEWQINFLCKYSQLVFTSGAFDTMPSIIHTCQVYCFKCDGNGGLSEVWEYNASLPSRASLHYCRIERGCIWKTEKARKGDDGDGDDGKKRERSAKKVHTRERCDRRQFQNSLHGTVAQIKIEIPRPSGAVVNADKWVRSIAAETHGAKDG